MQFAIIASLLMATAALSLVMRYYTDTRTAASTMNAAYVRGGGNLIPASLQKSYPICRSGGSRGG
jgi:hypothetical protein